MRVAICTYNTETGASETVERDMTPDEEAAWLSDHPPATLADARATKLAALAARRWEAEVAGTTVSGVTVSTDRESQSMITGAALAATLDPEYSVAWKTVGGAFITLTAPQILALAQGVRAHVQACFDHEAELASAMSSAVSLAQIEEIDIGSGWPTA